MKAICDSHFKLVLLAKLALIAMTLLLACEGGGAEPTARPDLGSETPVPEATVSSPTEIAPPCAPITRHGGGAHRQRRHAWDGAGRPDWRARKRRFRQPVGLQPWRRPNAGLGPPIRQPEQHRRPQAPRNN